MNDSADEQLAVYDAAYQKIGNKRRYEVHRDGDRHYVMHCWVYIESKDAVVIQKRSEQKKFGGGKYDVSCAGHYSAHEDFTATRELIEELGIEAQYDQLQHLFDFEEVFRYDGMCDREIARVHLLVWPESALTPTVADEVESIFLVGRLDFMALMTDSASQIESIDGNPKVKMRRSNFVERDRQYYQQICAVFSKIKSK
jgi:isopentenyldiphosphate isomerase